MSAFGTHYSVVDEANAICMRARQAKAPCCANGAKTGKTKAEPCWVCRDEESEKRNRALPAHEQRD